MKLLYQNCNFPQEKDQQSLCEYNAPQPSITHFKMSWINQKLPNRQKRKICTIFPRGKKKSHNKRRLRKSEKYVKMGMVRNEPLIHSMT